jgi:hypothetical protein
MLSLKAILVLALAVWTTEAKKPAFGVSSKALLQVRGGADIGPIDVDLAVKMGKVATSMYIAGCASKFIADKTGTEAPKVCT